MRLCSRRRDSFKRSIVWIEPPVRSCARSSSISAAYWAQTCFLRSVGSGAGRAASWTGNAGELRFFGHAIGLDRGLHLRGRAAAAVDVLDQPLLGGAARLGNEPLFGRATLARPDDLERVPAALHAFRIGLPLRRGGRRARGAAHGAAGRSGIAGTVLVDLAAAVKRLGLDVRAEKRGAGCHHEARCCFHLFPPGRKIRDLVDLRRSGGPNENSSNENSARPMPHAARARRTRPGARGPAKAR
jgi:hypothetical protein